MDVTGIKDLNAVYNAANKYKRDLYSYVQSVSNKDIQNAVKGNVLEGYVKTYDEAVKSKVKSIIDTLDLLIESIDEIKANYARTVTNPAGQALGSAAGKLKS